MLNLTFILIICLRIVFANDLTCPPKCLCHENIINCSRKLFSLSNLDHNRSYDSINLSHNNLEWLPALNAKTLDVSSNVLQDFPILGYSIKSLILRNNSIRFVHSNYCPPNLKHLDISENPIKEVNIKCEKLEKLNLSHGDIETLPDNFLSKFQALKFLSLDHNPLKKISGDLSSQTLEVFSIQGSQLRYIKPSMFTNLSKLKVIDISGSKLIHTLNPETEAEYMIANDCALENVDLSGMPRVVGVEVSNNHITNLVLPNSVLELRASNNLIYDIHLNRIKKADLSRNSLVSLQLTHMDFLNISGNPISNLRLASIHYLDASHCNLIYLEGHRSKLYTLNLSHNSLEMFPYDISVKKLDVSFNRLSTFKSKIEGIEELWLVGNRLVLAEDVEPQGDMYLQDNPWTCDCKMDHLYLRARDAKSLTCFHPSNVSGQTWTDACYKKRIPRWMLKRPYMPFIISSVLLLFAMFFFYWLRRKLDISPETNNEVEETRPETVSPQITINNELPSYEEALLMPGLSRKKNAMSQTRSYEVLSRRLSSNSI